MPNMKTNESVAKRVKITGRGKVKRNHPGTGHLKSVKSPSRLRRARKNADVSPGFAKQALRMLGLK